MTTTRRSLLAGAAALALAGSADAAELIKPSQVPPPGRDEWRGLKMGVATYSLRKLPLDAAIKGIQRVGLRYCSIKDFHLALKSTAQERRDTVAKFKDAGITPLSCGVVTLNNDEAAVRNAFEYARDCGMGTIVANPAPEALPLVERFVKEFDIRIAIHNHGPEDKRFPGPDDAMKAVRDMDPRMGLCIDVGHTARAKVDPADAFVRLKERLFDIHFKDIRDPNAKSAGAAEIEVGRGVLDIKGMLAALLKINYAHHVGFEYEPWPNDPVPGLAECVGYTKGVLAGLP
jgi:inosose dehydratase